MSFWAQVITSNLAMASLIGGLAWLVGRNGRLAPLAHTLWLLFFIKLITPPLITIPLPVPENWWFMEVATAANETADSTSLPHLQNSPPLKLDPASTAVETSAPVTASTGHYFSQVTWTHLIVGVWLVGVFWFVIRSGVKIIRFHQLLRHSGTVDEEATRFVHELLEKAGEATTQQRGPQVLRVPIRVSPMLFGLGQQARIVCPQPLWDAFGEEEREAFLAHEAAHYHRRDHWVRWLEWSVTAIYWWFPGVYFARHQLERHEEACCDAWAVRMLATSPRQYAEALLQVVDFISEYRVGMVRLASGMQPTYTLEERLHLIMKGGSSIEQARRLRNWLAVAYVVFCLLHPIVKPYRSSTTSARDMAANLPTVGENQHSTQVSLNAGVRDDQSLDLPPAPEGFWNRRPQRRWADVTLSLPGAHLIADTDEGIRFVTAKGETLHFRPQELTAVAEVAATKRVLIGNEQGQIRLWDLTAGMPVSLIGSHPAAVTSVAYHETTGVVSADGAGSVMRWDMQSGQVLATWAESSQPVQSVRVSNDGGTLAILSGQWEDLSSGQQVYLVESQSLKTSNVLIVPPATAVVLASPTAGWVAVNWSGAVRDLESGLLLANIPKHEVSALVFCQDCPLHLLPGKESR
ncbi:hypothetical protein GC197_00195 [bacterium]|nr:hypothetical protein [bacterium]